MTLLNKVARRLMFEFVKRITEDIFWPSIPLEQAYKGQRIETSEVNASFGDSGPVFEPDRPENDCQRN
jgi:hypothetical protein